MARRRKCPKGVFCIDNNTITFIIIILIMIGAAIFYMNYDNKKPTVFNFNVNGFRFFSLTILLTPSASKTLRSSQLLVSGLSLILPHLPFLPLRLSLLHHQTVALGQTGISLALSIAMQLC